jgi:hypothetical protein
MYEVVFGPDYDVGAESRTHDLETGVYVVMEFA